MTEMVRNFYDELAANYHWIFDNWEASMERQASVLGPLLERECGPAASLRILDCACGIGTQSLGLARLGFHVTGSDISPRAVERARRETAERGLDLRLYVMDMLHLDDLPAFGFDAVLCMDNALPHLDTDAHLLEAAHKVRSRLRKGGTFIASIRDYDRLLQERPVSQGPAFHADAGRRRIVFQVWDWQDERRYALHLYITRETREGWQSHHGVSRYRAVLRGELTLTLEHAGFRHVRWLLPQESGFYQPLVLAAA